MTAELTRDDAQYAFDIVKKICDQAGPGAPATSQEHDRARMIKEEMETLLGPENVTTETFIVAPHAFLGWLRVSAVLALAAALLNMTAGQIPGLPAWLAAAAALVLAVAAMLPGIFEFMFYFEFIDGFCRKKESVNVIGRLRKPGAETIRRVLILGGHHDSALEMTWLRWLGYGYYFAVATLFIGFFGIFALSLVELTGVLAGHAGLEAAGRIGWILMLYPVAPAVIFAFFFVGSDKGGGQVPGAADNLSACALSLAMARFLAAHPEEIPADTEIRIISFGSEEAGLRGSSRYVARHLAELQQTDTRLLNLETVTHPRIKILTSDVNGFVKNDPDIVDSVRRAAERAGVPFTVGPFPFGGGGTDAGSFSRAGLKATCLLPFQVPGQMVRFYHQRHDAPDILTLEPFHNVLKLVGEWIRTGGK